MDRADSEGFKLIHSSHSQAISLLLRRRNFNVALSLLHHLLVHVTCRLSQTQYYINGLLKVLFKYAFTACNKVLLRK